MEENGIGTDASIPSHIKNIIDKGFVTVGPGRTFIPSSLGMALARGLCDIDPELILPSVRANIEKSCSSIAAGELAQEDVVQHVIDIFKGKYKFYADSFESIIKMIQDSIIAPAMQKEEAKKNAHQTLMDSRKLEAEIEMNLSGLGRHLKD
jgi:DNA topoisomerase-3